MDSDTTVIYHLTPAEYYRSLPADQPYRPREFDRDGFIHCTKGEERLLLVADTLYRRVPGEFLLLAIDERKVTSPVKHENVGGIMFPHIYGPLNRDAIVRIVAMGRREDGTFLPIGEPDVMADDAAVTEAWLSQARVEQLIAESADLRARTLERLDSIERAIAALKTPIPSAPATQTVQAAPVTQPAQAQPTAPIAHAGATARAMTTELAPASAIEARLERVERSLHQLAGRIDSLEQQAPNLKSQISKRAPTRGRRPARKSPGQRR